MKFQRLDTGEIFDAKMPSTIIFGEATITIDGQPVKCRKVTGGETSDVPPALVSDALGFGICDLQRFQADKVAHNFSGVEFKEDPKVKGFYQVHFAGPEERRRYEKHRGFYNTTSNNGSAAMLSPHSMEQAREQVIKRYGAA